MREWMRMEETQTGFAATGSGGLGIDGTTFIEVVEPSSFVAVGDRLLVHLNSSHSVACFGDTQTYTNSSCVPLEEPGE